jgi:hypothetical protein
VASSAPDPAFDARNGRDDAVLGGHCLADDARTRAHAGVVRLPQPFAQSAPADPLSGV